MADLNVKVGQKVETQDGKQGTVRYIGQIHVASGEWLGLELADDTGKNDGSVKGERYFNCAPGHGIFVRKESAVRILSQPVASAKANGISTSSGPATKPRPSSIAAADVARKRQSLMSAGSATTTGSRSMRSPIKSPTKPAPSSATSSASTPRTGTPATTARTSDSSTKSRLSLAGKSTMAPPASVHRPNASASRQSIGGPVKTPATRPSSMQPRSSMAASRLSINPKAPPRPEKTEPVAESIGAKQAPPVVEEQPAPTPSPDAEDAEDQEPSSIEARTSVTATSRSQPPAGSRNGFSSTTEDRSRQAQVIKALETKVRTLQKQRQEDQAQIQSVQELQSQATRYEGIIQTLQKRLKTNQQEIQELKAKYEDAEARATQVPDRGAEHDSELELATLDKEMAEERADMFESELEALKLKHEELELEAEILREENRELASIMSPEEKASAGWLQMERETERLRQALVMLRDVTQQNEGDLRNEIKELHETIDELGQTASKYDEVAAKLSRAEETNQHLREQLEAAEANDEILDTLGQERDQNRNLIEQLKRQVQDLEEHIQVADELEAFHVEEEKRLHYQLDESEAMLHDRHRQAAEQEKTIEDMEYTLTKFRDVVQGLQSDIDELRRSREISELEANEMSSKSRAMMDLNLKLQNSAAKSQLKAIDLELGKMRAEQASLHLEIVQHFVPDTFDVDKKPILALLCFKRIRSKAQLCKVILADRMRDRAELHENPMAVFAVMERLSLISNLCERFVQHLSTCSTDDFMRYAGAPFELEPVEQAMTSWVEALRRDELGHEGAEYLQRMADILVDMSEKFVPDTHETKAMEMNSSISMIENYTDNIASRAQILSKAVQAKLGAPNDGDEESILFEKKMDQLGIKARTIKYVSGKVMHAISDLWARSMCLGEAMWSKFVEAELCAEALSHLTQRVGESVFEELNKMEMDEALSYSKIITLMTAVASGEQQQNEPQGACPDDVFEILLKQLQVLQGKIDDLNAKSADISCAIEFEKLPAPWTARAREVKAQKALSQDLQEEMSRLKLKIQEQTIRISEKDKELEEQQVKVELLESRAKETKAKDEGVKEMKEEITRLRAENAAAVENVQRLETEYQTLLESQESQKMELEAVKHKGMADGQGLPLGPADESATLRLKAEVDQLKLEIISLQAAIRFLKSENRRLMVPVGDLAQKAVEHEWLDPNHLKGPSNKDARTQQLRGGSKEVFASLMDMAKTAKPVRLKRSTTTTQDNTGKTSYWRARTDTTLYQVLQRREELERWNEMKDDLLRRARIVAQSGYILKPTAPTPKYRPASKVGVFKVADMEDANPEFGVRVDGICIV
ncbi:dynactin [Fonsecaea pedrosoi]|nr:dynactin [Fonsecaea pedrosoi]